MIWRDDPVHMIDNNVYYYHAVRLWNCQVYIEIGITSI